jgi:hypothetical protein
LICSRCHEHFGRAAPGVVHVRLNGRQHAWTLPDDPGSDPHFDADCPTCGPAVVRWDLVERAAREGRDNVLVRLRRVCG